MFIWLCGEIRQHASGLNPDGQKKSVSVRPRPESQIPQYPNGRGDRLRIYKVSVQIRLEVRANGPVVQRKSESEVQQPSKLLDMGSNPIGTSNRGKFLKGSSSDLIYNI